MIDIFMNGVSIIGAIFAMYLLIGSFVITAKYRKNDATISEKARRLGMRRIKWPIDV